jgi:hypothetical protein
MDDETRTEPPVKPLRGQDKRDLITDIANGDATYGELADRWGISLQGVKEFAKRNKLPIIKAKQNMASDFAGIPSTDKRERVTDADSDLDALNELLRDPNLSHAERARYYQLKMKLRHSIADECGQLLTRTSVEVSVPEPIRIDNGIRVDLFKAWGELKPGESMLIKEPGMTPSLRVADENGHVSTYILSGLPTEPGPMSEGFKAKHAASMDAGKEDLGRREVERKAPSSAPVAVAASYAWTAAGAVAALKMSLSTTKAPSTSSAVPSPWFGRGRAAQFAIG